MTETISELPQHNDASYAQLFMTHPELHQQLGLERSYGFLLAAASAPSLVMPDEWLQAVWIEQPTLPLDSSVQTALVGLYNHWQIQKKQSTIELPKWQQHNQSIEAFCAGYLAGQDWLHNLWQESLQRFGKAGDERTLSASLIVCLRLSAASQVPELARKLSEQEALHLLPSRLKETSELGQRLFDAHQQASSQQSLNSVKNVGRNDPCPCGSGKKFKKCCGGHNSPPE